MKRKHTPTSCISRASARNLHHAFRFTKPVSAVRRSRSSPPTNANSDLVLNLVVTINWDLTVSGVDLFDELRNERLCQWLRTRSKQLGRKIEPTYAFVREKNHVHWCIHVPDDLIEEFKYLVPRWITSLELKGIGDRRRSENLPPTPNGKAVDIDHVRDTIWIRKYMLKGIERRSAALFGIYQCIDQGVIRGRRAGTSRNLGKAARELAGYQPRRRPYRQWRVPLPVTPGGID